MKFKLNESNIPPAREVVDEHFSWAQEELGDASPEDYVQFFKDIASEAGMELNEDDLIDVVLDYFDGNVTEPLPEDLEEVTMDSFEELKKYLYDKGFEFIKRISYLYYFELKMDSGLTIEVICNKKYPDCNTLTIRAYGISTLFSKIYNRESIKGKIEEILNERARMQSELKEFLKEASSGTTVYRAEYYEPKLGKWISYYENNSIDAVKSNLDNHIIGDPKKRIAQYERSGIRKPSYKFVKEVDATLEEAVKYYPQDYDSIEINYDDLEIVDNKGDEITIDYTYEVDKDDFYTFIFEQCIDVEDFPRMFDDDFDPDNKENWNSFVTWLEDNFDEIFTKYEEQILDNYRSSAVVKAEENCDPDDYIDWDLMPGGHDDYRFDENLNEMKEVKTYKSYEMRADYDVDPEDGNMSLAVHIYKNGKEVRQNEFGSELTFENFREARKWIDTHTIKCSLEDKLAQFCSILNSKEPGSLLSVQHDKYGCYIMVYDEYYKQIVGKIYFKDDFSYDYVYYDQDDLDWYDIVQEFKNNSNLKFKYEKDEQGNVIGLEDAPSIDELCKKYFVPFTDSSLSSGSDNGDGLETLVDICDWIFGVKLSEEEEQMILDEYKCAYDKDFTESIKGDNMKFKVMNERYEPGQYGDIIFELLDKMSADQVHACLIESGYDKILGTTSDMAMSDVYTKVEAFLDVDSGVGLYKALDRYCGYHKIIESKEEKICCICKQPYEGYGNNAEPICSGRCCDKCNIERVVPMRFKKMNESKELNESMSIDDILDAFGGADELRNRVSDIKDNYPGIEDDEIAEMLADDVDYEDCLSAIEYLDEEDFDDPCYNESLEEDSDYVDKQLDDDYNYDDMDKMLTENTDIKRLRHMYGVED